MTEALFGVLVDVSGSMKSAYALDQSSDVSVECTHAILTTIMTIVNRDVAHHDQQESIFACAFGLSQSTVTCDLISLLEYIARLEETEDGHQALIGLAEEHRALHATPWIRDHLSQLEAQILYRALCSDRSQIPRLVELIPLHLNSTQRLMLMLTRILGREQVMLRQAVHRSEAYQLAHKIIKNFIPPGPPLQDMQHPNPRPVQHVYRMLDNLLRIKVSAARSSSLHDRIHELLEFIKPYIFGQTPMCRALNDAVSVFRETNATRKVLFILSDGQATDGDPRPIAEELRDLGVTIVTCFLTSDHIDNPRRLYYEVDPSWCPKWHTWCLTCRSWCPTACSPTTCHSLCPTCYSWCPTWRSCCPTCHSWCPTCHSWCPTCHSWKRISKKYYDLLMCDGRAVLFEMSSTLKNTHKAISILVDANWELPPSGESRLFAQANSSDVVNEFFKIAVSQMTESCDALVDLLEKMPLATYINQTNAGFEPKQQEGETCYANAIAAVFHLAMNRIVGREGGIPDFYEIRERIIRKYGVQGANTKKVLENDCPEYRLHFRQVDETGARQAINKRRPVVARFSLYDEQWKKFKAFYKKTPKEILKKCDCGPRQPGEKLGGHAVVLIGCDPNCLTFINSWGQEFADGGFFRVKDQSVLNDTKFYDVYWTLNDLKQSEIETYKREGIKRSKELLQKYSSVGDLFYQCPKCNQRSRVGEFLGHILEAECPKCHQKFKPTIKEIMQSLYTQAHNL